MQGTGGHDERLFLLKGKDVGLRFDDDNTPSELQLLDGALGPERHVQWTGVMTVAGESFESLELYAAAALPHFCLLACAPGAARSAGLILDGEHQYRPAHVEGRAFAYLISRQLEDGRFEFGVAAFGADSEPAADRMADLIRRWNDLRPDWITPKITLWPANTPATELPEGFVIDKRHRRIVLS
jgi:protein-L-isoaspartate(D-aspartate) O-methyltransferase